MNRRITCISLIVFGTTWAMSDRAGATSISIGASKDTTIYENAVNNSNGSGSQILTGNDSGSLARRGLIAFNLPIGTNPGEIPAGSTITLVTLTLNLVASASMGPNNTNVELHRLEADWGEAGSAAGTGGGTGTGVAAQTGDATWNRSFYDTVSWTPAGGDFVAAASATQSIDKTNGAKSWQSAGMVVDVQLWLDSPIENFGWIIMPAVSDLTTQTERRFATRNHSTEALRPQLTIEFTEPESAATPEPATWALACLGLASWCLVAARRRKLASRDSRHADP